MPTEDVDHPRELPQERLPASSRTRRSPGATASGGATRRKPIIETPQP